MKPRRHRTFAAAPAPRKLPLPATRPPTAGAATSRAAPSMPTRLGNLELAHALHQDALHADPFTNTERIYRKCAGCDDEVKLKGIDVSQPHDADELEADRLADDFVAGRASGSIARSRNGSDVRRAPAGPTAPVHAGQPLAAVATSGGTALPARERARYERFFNADLSSVRIHDNFAAAQTARQLNAYAFARGTDVYFDRGRYQPNSTGGQRLLAHELAHVLQGGDRIARAEAPPEVVASRPPPLSENARRWAFKGVQLADDGDYMKYQMRELIARAGIEGGDEWLNELVNYKPGTYYPIMPPAHGAASGGLRPRTQYDAARDVRDEFERVLLTRFAVAAYKIVRKEATDFLDEFYTQARGNASAVLQANEDQSNEELTRYGLSRTQKPKYGYDDPAMGGKQRVQTGVDTTYSMEADNPAAKGLQAAANLLLGRRRKIDKMKEERTRHIQAQAHATPQSVQYYGKLAKEVDEKIKLEKEEYQKLRGGLSQRFPALAAFSDLDQITWDLETLAEKGPGRDMAALLGARIYDQLDKIKRVRDNLDNKGEVNLWRQPKIVALTRATTGADADKWKDRVIKDKVEDEKPGILFDIAVGVLNIAALLLAGPTGGVSLIVAAGVNVVAAGIHVKEFLLESDLSGTAFDKANAISAEEPSLFWLAVDIIGVLGDVGPAAKAASKAFKSLKGPVRALQAAKEADEIAAATDALRKAARDALGETPKVESIIAQAKRLKGGDYAVVELTATRRELQALLDAEKLTEAEVIGKKLASAAGEVNLAKSGHIYTCHSPCRVLRDKYAAVIAKDPNGLGAEVAKLESEAKTIAKERKAAEASNNAKGIAEAEGKAQALKQKVADLEPKLRAQTPERLAKVKWLESLLNQHPMFKQIGKDGLERALARAPHVDAIKGQLLEELLGSRMADKAAREAVAGKAAVEAAAAAKSEIKFIPGHLIRDANGQLFTDGILAYKQGDTWHVVAVFESKAGRASAQKLKRGWKALPQPADAAEKARWINMTQSDIEALIKSKDPAKSGLGKKVERWKEARDFAIDELRDSDDSLAKLTGKQMEASHAQKIDEMMDALPNAEAGQARKTTERLVPNEGADHTKISIGEDLPDGTVRFPDGANDKVTGGGKTTKIVGVVPDNVKGRNLKKMAEKPKEGGEALAFELINDLGYKQADLDGAAQALANAAEAAP